jgi:hypothetical protein
MQLILTIHTMIAAFELQCNNMQLQQVCRLFFHKVGITFCIDLGTCNFANDLSREDQQVFPLIYKL